MSNLRDRLSTSIAFVWVAFLSYVALGGAAAQILEQSGAVQPYCSQMSDNSDVYEPCKPCSLYGGVFGVIESADCPNKFLKIAQSITVQTPRAFIAILSVFIDPLGEFAAKVWAPLPILTITLITIAITAPPLIKSPHQYHIGQKAIHRLALSTILILSTILSAGS